MIKKLLDTNIYIDLFSNPNSFGDILLSRGLVYLSSIVLMELIAGAHTKKARNSVQDIGNYFNRMNRIIIPSLSDYERAGGILIRLQRVKGYNLKKCDSITNDCLIAASCRSVGALLYTQNKKDFQAIQEVFDFKVLFI